MASLAAISMWVLIRTDSMHSALWVSDEAHAAHVARQVIDVHAGRRLGARLAVPQIQLPAVHIRKNLIPLVERLHVDRADAMTGGSQLGNQMSTNEAARSGDKDQIIGHVG